MTQAAARARAERINIHIITTYANRRARVGEGMGERATPGAARPAMELAQITETEPPLGVGCKPRLVEVTRPGFHTARRRLPMVLRRMKEHDERRAVAEVYARAVEKIGSVAGASAEGVKADGGAASNDGGVTTRIQYADTIRKIEAVLTEAGTAIAPGRRDANSFRKAISARKLLDAICLEGKDMKSILNDAGWSGHRRDVATLSRAAEECLEDMARAVGLVPDAARRPEVRA